MNNNKKNNIMRTFLPTFLLSMASLVAMTFASCSSEDQNAATGDGNSSMLKIQVSMSDGTGVTQTPMGAKGATAVASRADNPSSASPYKYTPANNPSPAIPHYFWSGEDRLGIFVRKAVSPYDEYIFITKDEVGNKQRNQPIDNFRFYASGNYPQQLWMTYSSSEKPVLSSDLDGLLCAYWPYEKTMTFNGNVYDYDDNGNRILPPVNTNQPSVHSWTIDCTTGTDYMYCGWVGYNGSTSTPLNSTHPTTNIEMKHAQCMIKFSLRVASDYIGSASLTDFRMIGGFAMHGTMDITDGSYVPTPTKSGNQDTVRYYHQDSSNLRTLNTNTNYADSVFCLPFSETQPTTLHFSAIIDGNTYSNDISSITLMRGYIYNVRLVLANNELIISGVTIKQWIPYSDIAETALLPNESAKGGKMEEPESTK